MGQLKVSRPTDLTSHVQSIKLIYSPRGNLAVLGKEITPENAKIVARIQRAEAAQQNGFENLGFFAASIVGLFKLQRPEP